MKGSTKFIVTVTDAETSEVLARSEESVPIDEVVAEAREIGREARELVVARGRKLVDYVVEANERDRRIIERRTRRS